ncbi:MULTISPECIES: LysR family transcriptional regulator [unclassified Xanthobacter]|uniref:LysR family transcriptional regulator n=1 Tax=unclassified Xanthobacter TaxID=2623496 RepID=UPI001EDD19FF|nr:MULTISPECIES: LysR family transcriptional regulator [unclassified Xanthobacter]
MIDQYQLRYFLAVAELGNFTRAANRVGVTQPTLSAGIAKLEEKLGNRLFERNKRSVTLTPSGSRFLIRARRIAAEFDLAVQELKGTSEPRVLRFGILSTVPTAIVERLVLLHARRQSTETLEIFDGSERDLIDRLDRGRLDVALTVLRPHHARFRCAPLVTERYLLVLPLDHRLAEADCIHAEQLAGDRMVVRRHCEAMAEISRFFTQKGVRPHFALKTDSDERMLSLVRSGMGVGMMPESFQSEAVRFVRLFDFDLQREIGLLYGLQTEENGLGESLRQIYHGELLPASWTAG